MKKEHLLAAIFGMFLLAYFLDAIVDPPTYNLAQPYQFLLEGYYALYPLTTASVIIRGLAMFLTPVLLLSFIARAHTAKGITLLILGTLMNLYAIQVLATDSQAVPVEWALSLAYSGLGLFIPAILFFIRSGTSSLGQKFSQAVRSEALGGTPDWIDEPDGKPNS